MEADDVISLLQLQPHPREDGWFRESYRSDIEIPAQALPPDRYGAGRNVSTAIYFLLKEGAFSAFHRVRSDEVFHYYLGGPAELFMLSHGEAAVSRTLLGPNLALGESPQILVPANYWQALRPLPGSRWILVGCTVAPGFDYADYEHGDRMQLTAQIPSYAQLIAELTTQDRATHTSSAVRNNEPSRLE